MMGVIYRAPCPVFLSISASPFALPEAIGLEGDCFHDLPCQLRCLDYQFYGVCLKTVADTAGQVSVWG